MSETAQTTPPSISVVMGVYNGGKKIRPTVESILGQTFGDFEFIVVDDGSTDNSGEILSELAKADSRLQIIGQSNQGLTKALVTGCRRASGQWIARQDVGDCSLPHRFERQIAVFQSREDVVAVGAGGRMFGPRGEDLGERVRNLSPEEITAALLNHGVGLSHMVSMFRRDAFERVGGYRAEFRFAQDTDLWYRLSRIGRLAEVGEVLFQWSIDVDGISSTNHDRQRQLALLARESHDELRRGGDDAGILRRAHRLSWEDALASKPTSCRVARSTAEYFIGSQLFSLGDHRCRGYLRRAIGYRPLWLRPWLKLTMSLLSPRQELAKDGA